LKRIGGLRIVVQLANMPVEVTGTEENRRPKHWAQAIGERWVKV
jgi:hypothetical protein